MPFSTQLLRGVSETIVLHTINELGEGYGYQLIQAIKSKGSGAFDMQEGTLYPLLYRLEDKAIIKSTVRQIESGKSRRYYSLTSNGKKLLKENKQEIKSFFLGVKGALNLSV